ncbi:MAG TPA: hypothetical protein ENH60_00600 [Pricia sp.]|nr:hypothetical protein [Pricia sp.]
METNPLLREYQRHISLKSKYGIGIEQYNKMIKKQNYCCAICGIFEKRATHKRLCVDHEHITGHVRGLLCHKCNTALSVVEDTTFVANARNYLMETITREFI